MARSRADALILERLFQNLKSQAATARTSGRSRGRSPVRWNLPWASGKSKDKPRETELYRPVRDLRVRDHSGTYTARVVGAHHQRRPAGSDE